MKYREMSKERTKRLLFLDKLERPSSFIQTLKLEIYSSLCQFAELKPEDIKLFVTCQENGHYKIEIEAITKNIKPIGVVLK